MALSDKEADAKKNLKSGVIGVAVLLVMGLLGPVIIGELTGVDLETLCEEGAEPGTDACPEDGEITEIITTALGYVSTIVAIIGFVALLIIGIKY